MMYQRGGSKENKQGLSSDKGEERKGWHSREIKLREFKGEEGHLALGVEGHLALG
jgi:hypothetical protein